MLFKFRLDLSPARAVSTPDVTPYSSHSLSYGDYHRDVATGNYNMCWESLHSFQTWLKDEEGTKLIELRRKERRLNKGQSDAGWTEMSYFVCAREGSGGEKPYQKKHPERGRKVPGKRCENGCTCRLMVKSYPNTSAVLGTYTSTHSHPIGDENAKFTRLSKEVRERIAEMLRIGISADNIVCVTRVSLFGSYIDCMIARESKPDLPRRSYRYFSLSTGSA